MFLAAAALARLADEGARVGLILLALDRTGSPAVGGSLVAAFYLPHVVAAPLIGYWVDRSRRPLRLIAAILVGFAIGMAAVTGLTGQVPLPVLLAVALAGGTCGPALTGALTSQLATVVPERHIGRAFGLDSLTYTLASLAGPTIAALLVTGTTPTAGMLALSTIALCAAATLALLPSQAALASEHPPNLLATARAIGRDRMLGVTVWTAAVAQIGLGTLPVVAVTIAQQHHPALAGVLLSGIAAGAVAGSLLWTWRPARDHRVALAGIGGLIGTGAPLAVAAVIAAIAVPIEPVAIGCLFALSGLATGYGSAAVFVIRHELSPPGTRSQVFTLASGIKITGAAAGTAIAGLVATTPLTLQLALAAAPPLLAGAAGLLIVRTRSTPPPDRRHRPSI